MTKPSITEIKVRGYHLDLFGHVNNARYLEFLEEARWALVEGQIDLEDWRKRGIGFSIVNININYRRPAVMHDMLEISSWVSNIGNTSGTIHQDVRLKGTSKIIVDADVAFVMVDIKNNKPLAMKGDIRSVFENLMASED